MNPVTFDRPIRKEPTMPNVRWLLLGALAFLGVPACLAAQSARLIPWVGLYAPTSDLGSVTGGEGISGAVDFGEKKSTLALGAALEIGERERMLGFRLGGAYATASDLPVAGLSCVDCVRSTLLAATADLVFRPLPRLLVIQPYALGGAGLKRYSFDFDEGVSTLADDQSKVTGHVGVGAQLSLAILDLNVEISDYLSGVDLGQDGEQGQTQHDLFFTLGLVF